MVQKRILEMINKIFFLKHLSRNKKESKELVVLIDHSSPEQSNMVIKEEVVCNPRK